MDDAERFDDVIAGIRRAADVEHRRDGKAEAFGRAPDLAPQAVLHRLFPPVTSALLKEADDALGRPLPGPYVRWLERSNGLWLFAGSLSLDGIRDEPDVDGTPQPFDLLRLNLSERPGDASDGMLFVGGYDADGSLLYLDDDDRVHRCPRESVEPLTSWPSFAEMLHAEFHRLDALFGEDGRRVSPGSTAPPAGIP